MWNVYVEPREVGPLFGTSGEPGTSEVWNLGDLARGTFLDPDFLKC